MQGDGFSLGLEWISILLHRLWLDALHHLPKSSNCRVAVWCLRTKHGLLSLGHAQQFQDAKNSAARFFCSCLHLHQKVFPLQSWGAIERCAPSRSAHSRSKPVTYIYPFTTASVRFASAVVETVFLEARLRMNERMLCIHQTTTGGDSLVGVVASYSWCFGGSFRVYKVGLFQSHFSLCDEFLYPSKCSVDMNAGSHLSNPEKSVTFSP